MRGIAAGVTWLLLMTQAPPLFAGPLVPSLVQSEQIGELRLGFPTGWVFTSDGTTAFLSGDLAAGGATVIARLARDPDGGALTFLDLVADPVGGEQLFFGELLALGPGGTHLYAAGLTRVSSLSRDAGTGALVFQQRLDTPTIDGSIVNARGLAIAPDGRHLYVGAYQGVAGYPIAADGSLGSPDFIRLHPTWLVSVNAVTLSPDGRFLYAVIQSQSDDDFVVALARDPESGTLTEIQRITDGFDDRVSLGDLYSGAAAPDGRHLFVGTGSDSDGAVVAFRRNADDGRLAVVGVYPREGGEPPPVSWIASADPAGALVFAGGGDRMAVYHRHQGTGALSLLQTIVDAPESTPGRIEAITPAPGGRHVYVAGGHGRVITVFRRACGDAHVDPDELCDDGNSTDGDGCDGGCRVEPCWSCSGTPSACAPIAATCDDANPCTSGDTCTAGTCVGTTTADGTACDDGNACTTGDACHAGSCTSSGRLSCGTCETCDRASGCVGATAFGCRHAAEAGPAGLLALGQAAGSDRLQWRWAAGGFEPPLDFGDPRSGPGYELCVFDLDGLRRFPPERRRRRVVLASRIAGGGECNRCWRQRRDGAFVYRGRGPSAIRRLVLQPASDGIPTIRVAGAGRRLPIATPPLTPGVTVQLIRDDGACWEARFDDFVRANGASGFRARGGVSDNGGD